MFEEILGIPAHPLLIHAAVVFIPLQVLAGIAYAFLPWARRHAGWFVFGIAFVAPGAALLAKLSGDAFRARLARRHAGAALLAQIDQHRSFGTTTLYFTAGLSVLLLIMLLVHRGALKLPGEKKEGLLVGHGFGGLLLAVVVLAVGVGTGYYVFRTGDTGAHIAWGGS